MTDITAGELVAALTGGMGIDDDEDPLEYLIDSLTEAIALLLAALDEALKATRDDERNLL